MYQKLSTVQPIRFIGVFSHCTGVIVPGTGPYLPPLPSGRRQIGTTKMPRANRYSGEKKMLERVLAYLEKLPPAVSGSGGHNATLRVACECYRFGLSDSEALEALEWFNAYRCSPPWKSHELRHKLDDARKIVSATGEANSKARGSRPVRVFRPPSSNGSQPADTRPICQRSAAEEEIWWAKVALERGMTLETFDRRAGL